MLDGQVGEGLEEAPVLGVGGHEVGVGDPGNGLQPDVLSNALGVRVCKEKRGQC